MALEPEEYYQEIKVELGWGWPELVGYWQHWPEYGSEWIKTVNPNVDEPQEEPENANQRRE